MKLITTEMEMVTAVRTAGSLLSLVFTYFAEESQTHSPKLTGKCNVSLFFFFWLHHKACRIIVPEWRLNVDPWQWEHRPNHWTTREFPKSSDFDSLNAKQISSLLL